MASYYISEKKAAELLSRLTGQIITLDDMDEFANRGIVPAYMRFKPKDKVKYPGSRFQLVQPSTVSTLGHVNLTWMNTDYEMQMLPFPLPEGGTLEFYRGPSYMAFVANADGGLVEITDTHYARVYAPQEVRLAASNILRSPSPLSTPAISHSCGETWELPRDDQNDADSLWIISPFAGSDATHVEKRSRKKSIEIAGSEEPPSMRLIIAGMLEMIEKLGPKGYFTQDKINEELRELMPKDLYRGMGEDSIKSAFAAANSAKRDALLAAGVPAKRKNSFVITMTRL